MEAFVAGEYDRVDIVYNQFKNAATQIPVVEQFLPVAPPEASEESGASADYIFEPGKAETYRPYSTFVEDTALQRT